MMQPQDPTQPNQEIQPTSQVIQPIAVQAAQPQAPVDAQQPTAVPQPYLSQPVAPQPKRHTKLLIILIVVLLLIGAGVVALLMSKKDTDTGRAPQNSSTTPTTNTTSTSPLTEAAGYQAKARDTERMTDISSIRTKLEAYYAENGNYPALFTASSINVNAEALKDPIGNNTIKFYGSVKDKAAALAVPAPRDDTSSSAAYMYIPFPSGCVNDCKGYILKSFIELPTDTTPNPYVKESLS